MPNHKKILFILTLVIIIAQVGSYLFFNRLDLLEKFKPEAYKSAYLGSAYNLKNGAPVSDYIVYGYAAWEYIHGKNPTLINPEMPPLGKYLMGISILLFQRIKIFSLIFGGLSLILIFLIGKIILKSNILSLIPVAILSLEPLFIKQINEALLDIYHLFFTLLSFYFFLSRKKGRFFYIFACLSLGGVIATKFYSTGVIIVFSWLISLLLERDYCGLLKLCLCLPLALLVLAASYFKIFVEGENLRRFFGIQKWIWGFHSSGKFLVPPGSIWQLIFLKKWITWWADRRPLPAPDWQITWPISIFISLLTAAAITLRKIKITKEAQIILTWIIMSLASLSFGISYPRYLLPILPFTYIISILSLQKILGNS